MFTGYEEHEISFDDASVLTKEYRANDVNTIKGGFFGKRAIQKLLNQVDAVGIRIYLGQDENKLLKFILVGVDKYENDLIGNEYCCMEYSVPCPNQCGTNNMLNS